MPRRDQSLVDHSTEDMASEGPKPRDTETVAHTYSLHNMFDRETHGHRNCRHIFLIRRQTDTEILYKYF